MKIRLEEAAQLYSFLVPHAHGSYDLYRAADNLAKFIKKETENLELETPEPIKPAPNDEIPF